jgi:hypothetical protein
MINIVSSGVLGFERSSHRFGQEAAIRLRKASGLPAPNSYFANAAVMSVHQHGRSQDIREVQLDQQWNNATLSKKFGYGSKRNAQQLLSDLSDHQLKQVVPRDVKGFEVAPQIKDR